MASHPLQRRTILTLVASQILGGVGVASGIAVTALLARSLSSSDTMAGFGTTSQVFGGAVLAVPLARIMAHHGRRPGLILGYLIAIAGSLFVIAASIGHQFWLLLVGTTLFGAATAANSQTRYAATDLAAPQHRGRDLSLVVWATTIGSVLGPNLVGPAEPVAHLLGWPSYAGSYLFSIVGFALAALLLWARLRPDPLLVARAAEVAEHPDAAREHVHGSARSGFRILAAHPDALLGLIVLAVGHAVMVGVMVMTPLHMDHGGAELRLIGLVISVHIFGMYALSPLSGMAVDRFGGRPVALLGCAVLVGACLLAAQTHEGMSTGLAVSLFLLGVGWSGTFVSGSTLITGAVEVHDRPATQGVSDLIMGLAGGGAGACSGVILQVGGYHALALIGAFVAAAIVPAVLVLRVRR